MNSFFGSIGLTEFKPNRSFMTRRSRRKLARKLKESAPQSFEACQTNISEFTITENLKAKIQANKTSKKDELESLKAKALAKTTDMSENTKTSSTNTPLFRKTREGSHFATSFKHEQKATRDWRS